MRRLVAGTIAATLIAGCYAVARPPPQPPANDPVVDMECVARARSRYGELFDDLPAQASGFAVSRTDRGVHMHRDGRRISEAEGKRLWDAFNARAFAGGGIAGAGLGMYSVYTCADAAKPSCIKLDMWVCQTSVATLAARLAAATAEAGLTDAELTVDATFLEARGLSCRKGPACTPAAHYSTPNAEYEPDAERNIVQYGAGSCADDGDCEGAHSNLCLAWYLRGGSENSLYIQFSNPTFCGCVSGRCAWFVQ